MIEGANEQTVEEQEATLAVRELARGERILVILGAEVQHELTDLLADFLECDPP